jgi:hypothetical protein
MDDLALGAIVLLIAAMPASLLLLLVLDVIRGRAAAKRRWIVGCLALLVVPALGWLGRAVWGWAGAAHLEPLCAAYATPEFRGRAAPGTRSVVLDNGASEPPPWAAALLQPPLALDFVEWPLPDGRVARLGPDGRRELDGPLQSAYALEVRRARHHENRWFRVDLERFRVVDRSWGTSFAEGDELTLQAGARLWHCGIASGRAVTDPPADAGPGIARFLGRALYGPGGKRETIRSVDRSNG